MYQLLGTISTMWMKLMDPLGLRDIIRIRVSLIKRNVFLGILNTLVLVGQFEINDGMELNLNQLNDLHPTLNFVRCVTHHHVGVPRTTTSMC
jgi:hypothetical protein